MRNDFPAEYVESNLSNKIARFFKKHYMLVLFIFASTGLCILTYFTRPDVEEHSIQHFFSFHLNEAFWPCIVVTAIVCIAIYVLIILIKMMPFVPKLINKFRRWNKTANYGQLLTSHWKMKLWILTSILLTVKVFLSIADMDSIWLMIMFLPLGFAICIFASGLMLGPILLLFQAFKEMPVIIDNFKKDFENWLDR